jgi:hypothetical protein
MNLLSALKKTYSKTNKKDNSLDKLNTFKHFPSSVREWDNSIFVYNKNALPLIPSISKLALKLIKGYFSLYNWKIEKKLRTKIIRNKHRRLTSSKIYLSKGEFKHTNNKVIITLYTFNRQKNNYILKLKKRFIKKILIKKPLKKFLRKSIKINNYLSFFYKTSLFHNYNYIRPKKNLILNKTKPRSVKIRIINKVRIRNMKFLMKKLKNIKIKSILALHKASKNKHYIINVLDKLYMMKKIKGVSRYNKRMLRYIKTFYTWRIRKYLRKIIKYIYFKQLIYINKSKFNYTYLQYLKNYLQVLFNKNVEFNFINLKNFYLNSDILSESFLLKIKRKRGKLLNLITNLQNKIKIKRKVFTGKPVNIFNLKTKKNLNKYIINNLKYKHITGFRLEASGRLTKRHTASRSISKIKYKGNLWNIDSSLGCLSSILLKGNLNSNLQYTKLNSKTNIGSFGLKGWVSGY